MTLRSRLDQAWILGRHNDRFHVRFYPNPGFTLTLPWWTVKWSRFYGWKVT